MKKNDKVWQQIGNVFDPLDIAAQVDSLPAGVYSWIMHPDGTWSLIKDIDRFEFPFKIYDNSEPIIRRVETTWDSTTHNLGVLLNGVKGTGKSIAAQLLGNWAIDRGIPVLVIRHPIPILDSVLIAIASPVVVVFDEFEKTHEKPEDQQHLLTTVDGMTRTEHKRMFVFTTNEKAINENFVDRPSRIRYVWEFDRLSDTVLEGIVDDLLILDCIQLRDGVLTYLRTRKILSIDVVKTVVNEVNIYKESPEAFASILNLSEQDAKSFKIEILDSNREVTSVLSESFAPGNTETRLLRNSLVKGSEFAKSIELIGGRMFKDTLADISIFITGYTDSPYEWTASLQLPPRKTWVGKFKKVIDELYQNQLWLDPKPEDWTIPTWATKEKLSDDDESALNSWVQTGSVHGTYGREEFLIRITPRFEAPVKKSSYTFLPSGK